MRYLTVPGIIALVLTASSPAWSEETYRLGVDGLACPFCAYGVEKELRGTEGVTEIDVWINDGLVFVTVEDDAGFNEDRTRQIIADAGFTLRSFEQVTEPQ